MGTFPAVGEQMMKNAFQIWRIAPDADYGQPLETGSYDRLEKKMTKLRANATDGSRYYLSSCNGY
jgi:hypothetical protein